MKTVFSVSGNQILSLYDAFASGGLRIVHMRHESAAAYAAAGWAEATGELGIVLVAGGPGFLASLVGVAVAASMELPILLLSGGPPSTGDRPGAFQYLDQAKIASTICKRTLRIEDAAVARERIAEAVGAAHEGIPGPVHLTIPADVAQSAAPAIAASLASASFAGQSAPADETQLRAIAGGLAAAQRPLVIARPSAGRGATGELLRALGERLSVTPVLMESPRGSEDLKYRAAMRRYKDADYVLLIGPADFSVHFLSDTFIAPDGRVALIDTAGDPEPDRETHVRVRANPKEALETLLRHLPDVRRTPWIEPPANAAHAEATNGLHPFRLGEILRETLQPDDLIVLDGGEFGQWLRLALAPLPNQVIWNSRLGAIGGSIPLALGAALAQPERRILVGIGDGAFGYHASEIETAVREGARLTILIGNDDRWGAEWHTQREKYGRAVATMLGSVDYDAVARGFGALGYDAGDEAELRKALGLAGGADETVCLNVRIASVRSPATAP